MRIAYLDCFAGISGDMFLAALLDSGLDPKVLHEAAAALNLNVTLKIEKADRSGISATRVLVLEHGLPAESSHTHNHSHQQHQHTHEHHHHPKTQHLHKVGHSHDHHDHDHVHGRSLSTIRTLIQSTSLANPVKQTAIRAFELLGASEAKIHDVDIEKIHFHEVGAVDAIVDIVCASAGIHALAIDKWHSSPVNVGGGMVDCAHGRFPVPAPATADLLRDIPTYSAHVEQELTTPTGAAILRALSPTFGTQPAMRVQNIGYGAGSRNTKDFPNVLRLSIGETTEATHSAVAVLETAIDDLSPQILAHVTERALALGALDVMSTAVQMKKGRLGTLITILADDAQVPTLEDLLLRETSTLGVRIHHERRSCLERTHTTVTTPYGEIRIKVGTRNNETYNAAPEFEDCRAAAAKHNVPVKQVQQAAIAAWHNHRGSH
jgi:pyridinium-3,5-bisthiocarboxylic acid mononucleotide nickel chelatase